MPAPANYILFTGVGDGVTDDSTAFQAAINTAAALPGGGVVFVTPPAVAYVIDNIVLKSAVDIIGGSMRQTVFLAKSGSTNSMFVLDVGHVINCRYENFVCNPNGNANQSCFMLQATSGGTGDGGMWYSIFKNLFINAFDGYGIWFRGGPNGFNIPHQFITIDSCIIWHQNTTYSRSVLMTGQVGQVKIQGVCDFSGTGGTFVGYGCELSAEYVNTGAPAGQQHGGVLVGGTPVGGSNTPYNITFDTVTIQNCLTAIYTSNPTDVTIANCYFENVAQVIVAEAVTNGMNVRSCHFTNCGAFSGAGFILKMADQSCGSITACDVVGCDRFIANGSGNGGGQVYSAYNFMWNAPTNLDTNRTINVGGPTAAVGFFFQCYLNNTTAVTSITSLHTVGDKISFVNNNGGPSTTFTAGNNIKLGRWSTLTLGNLDTALFELSDITGGWQLVGTTGTLS